MVFDWQGTLNSQQKKCRIAKDETTIVFLDPEGDYEE